MDKRFPCVPNASFLPFFYILGEFFLLFVLYMCLTEGNIAASFVAFLFCVATLSFAVWCWEETMRQVEIKSNHIICRAWLCRNIVIDYEKATVGMDYHLQRGNKVWWIYLCYGPSPIFDSRKPYNRMNSLKCKQGFVRIMYREDVYDTLIAVLPKKQKTALISARRCAGL